jgi:hypothetical protein
MLPFRIMLVGGKFGPGVFDIAALIGKEETIKRIQHTLGLYNFEQLNRALMPHVTFTQGTEARFYVYSGSFFISC